MDQVYLSRRNLLTLLSKLDRVKAGEQSNCTIVKNDNVHPIYPQTMDQILITALEDSEYYDREVGIVDPKDDPNLNYA